MNDCAEERREIDRFRGKYNFLSNFYPARLAYDGLEFYNSEAAYQAAKCENRNDRIQFVQLYGDEAKRLASKISCRKDWDRVRIFVMREVLFEKFTQNPILAEHLLETGDRPLLEGNQHKDLFWGIDSKTGEGENHLGKLLMELRKEFRQGGIPDNSGKRPLKQYGPVNHMLLTDSDITQMDEECIVNASNTALLVGEGVDGAIHRAAGPELLEACRLLNGCRTGEARLTKGYRLKAEYIIHTAGPVYGKDDDSLLGESYRNCLDLAAAHQIHTIVFPAISTGKFCFPKKKAAGIAVSVVNDWIEKHAGYEMEVIFSCPDQKNYQEVLSELICL